MHTLCGYGLYTNTDWLLNNFFSKAVLKNTFCVWGGVGASKSARHGCECTQSKGTDHHHRGPSNHTAHHRGTHSTHGHSKTPHLRGKGWPASCTWNTSCTEPSALEVHRHHPCQAPPPQQLQQQVQQTRWQQRWQQQRRQQQRYWQQEQGEHWYLLRTVITAGLGFSLNRGEKLIQGLHWYLLNGFPRAWAPSQWLPGRAEVQHSRSSSSSTTTAGGGRSWPWSWWWWGARAEA